MGTITKRANPSGEIRYRAQIRISRKDYPDFKESKTFSKKSLAEAWIKKREAEIEANPDMLLGTLKKGDYPTLLQAIEQYLEEVTGFGRTKRYGLLFLNHFPIGKIRIDRLTRKDFADHVKLRRQGVPELGIKPVSASTANNDIQYIRSVFTHARLVWGMDDIVKTEIDLATEGLQHARLIAHSKQRSRLPTNEELQQLTTFFYRKWMNNRGAIPGHLIMWLAIYSCRRLGELFRLAIDDYQEDHSAWMIRNLKNPNGSEGNDKEFSITDKAKPIVDELLSDAVRKRMLQNNPRPELLLPVTQDAFDPRWREATRMLGIEDLKFHDLRHEGATRLAEMGWNIPQIQQLTLHDSWGSLQRYVNLRKRPNVLDFEQAMAVAKATIK